MVSIFFDEAILSSMDLYQATLPVFKKKFSSCMVSVASESGNEAFNELQVAHTPMARKIIDSSELGLRPPEPPETSAFGSRKPQVLLATAPPEVRLHEKGEQFQGRQPGTWPLAVPREV